MTEGRNDLTAKEIRERIERLEMLTLELGRELSMMAPPAYKRRIVDIFEKYRTDETKQP
jgi:hypothetical protein